MRSAWSLLAAAGLLAGCGGQSTFSSNTGAGGIGGGGFQGTVVTMRAAVVATDVDGDGRSDLVAVDREGGGTTKAWRNTGAGTFGEAPSSWANADALAALRDECDALGDAPLLDGMGVHRVGAEPFAVLHVGDGAGDAEAFPALESVEPPSGSPGDVVALHGQGLAAVSAPPTVTFGGTAAQVLYAFPDYVLVVVPATAPVGMVDVVVTRGGLASLPLPFTVVPRSAPVVTSVTPSTVVAGGLALVAGEGLGTPLADVSVTFSGLASPHVLAFDTHLIAEVPAGATSGPLVVTVDGLASEPRQVEVGALPPPVVTALVPAAASAGSLVRIEGSDLQSLCESLEVTFAGARAALFSLGQDSITVVVPAAATDGDVVVTVGGRASAGTPFDVVARGSPHVVAVEPSPAARGSMVHVRGTDLVDLSAWTPDALPPVPLFGDLRVSIGGTDAWFVFPTADGLDVLVPDGAASGDVVVRVDGHASNAVPLAVD